jgi:hypothetical protein
LGGSWNADVVPASRGDLLPLVLGFAILVASVVGVVIWWRQDRLATPLVIAALLAVLVGLAGVVAPNAAAQVVVQVPGIGLLRDGQRYLPPLVLLESIGLGAALAALLHVAPLKRLVAVTFVLLPIAALPGLAFGGGLKVSQYPADWKQARQVLADDPHSGDFIPWPFEAYRAPAWNGRRPVLDPMERYFTRQAVVPDELIVGGRRLAGEDPRSAAVADAVRAAVRNGTDPTAALLQQGVGWIVVDIEAGGPSPRGMVPQLTEVFAGPTVAVYRVNGDPSPQHVQPWFVVAVLLAWVLAAGVLIAALVTVVVRKTAIRSRI